MTGHFCFLEKLIYFRSRKGRPDAKTLSPFDWLCQADEPTLNFKGHYGEEYRRQHPTAPAVVPWASGVVSWLWWSATVDSSCRECFKGNWNILSDWVTPLQNLVSTLHSFTSAPEHSDCCSAIFADELSAFDAGNCCLFELLFLNSVKLCTWLLCVYFNWISVIERLS